MAKFLVLLLSLVIISIVLIEYSEAKHSKHSNQEKHKHPRHKHSPQSKESHKGHQDEINDDDAGWEYENTTKVDTRRILFSKQSKKGARPYMVYLQLTKESAKAHKYRGWLCGGVIVDRYYVLTSAACVEDADHFYVVSGTMKFVDSFDYKNNPCVCNNRRKVVWKCIPKNYKFDFQDSIKWSSNDIAIVKVNKPFKLGVCEKGCDFATDLICYNNISRDLERPGTKGIILGWGSGSNFREGVYRRQRPYLATNAKCLQEAKVCIMDNEQCAKKWSQRFRNIITQYMICTKDVMKRLSEICDKKYANCTDMEETRRVNAESTDLAPPQDEQIDLGRHLRDPFDYVARRSTQGGFCENDHGGPLIVKYQNKDRVIGVISACKIDPKSHSCHGPFLYTSVFKNRQFISCSIYKDVEESCRRVFRSGITHEEVSVNWDGVDEDTHNHENRDDNEEKANSESEKSDDDDDESNEVLRAKEEKKESKSPKKDASRSSDSSSSSSSGESLAMQKSGHDSEKKSDKTKKRNAKKRSGDKKQSPKKKETRKSNYGEARKRSDDRKEVFYESSRDENVNDPEEDE